MYDKNENLTCSKCNKTFEGRKPPEKIDIFCPVCINEEELDVVDGENNIPETVNDEMEGGGDDGGIDSK